MAIELYDYQEDAIKRMKNGCILCGGVGSGKSRTALAYYYTLYGGDLKKPKALKGAPPLYIITTARKRDTKEWEKELDIFNLTAEVIDSWNKVASYKDVENAFFIFDEQRVVGMELGQSRSSRSQNITNGFCSLRLREIPGLIIFQSSSRMAGIGTRLSS